MSDSEPLGPLPTRPRVSLTELRQAKGSAALRLERAIARAMDQGVSFVQLVAMLRKLVRETHGASRLGARARLMLAERLLSGDPGLGSPTAALGWECARCCREARNGPLVAAERARILALAGIAYCLLGCYRAARYSYYQALEEEPNDPVIAHNLGHLLHARLADPMAALGWLRKAHALLPSEPEIAASYAHVLVAVGDQERALDVLSASLGSRDRARVQISDWAPSDGALACRPRRCVPSIRR